LPTNIDLDAVKHSKNEMLNLINLNNDAISLVPDDTLPIMSGVFNAPIYGHNTWGSLFTSRQLLLISTYIGIIRTLSISNIQPGLESVIKTLLALTASKMASFTSSLCIWRNVRTCVAQTFGRQALPMVWDFGEMNPFAQSAGDFGEGINYLVKFIHHVINSSTNQGQSEQADAVNSPLPNDSADILFTDPPYYNAVPYADLSDFFYVWLHRALSNSHSDLFIDSLAPKDNEICEMSGWDPMRYSHKNGAWFEEKMTNAMKECRRVVKPSGIGIVVFAHKTTSGWEAQIQAMIKAGWIITGSWPVDTERPGRLRAHESAVLTSSIHLVCRARENPDGSVQIDDIGDWREVLKELPQRIHEWMPRLAKEGVVGADAIFACLGPALEIYSRYSSVEKASGENVTLKEYLEEVWAAVSREALSMIFEGADSSGFEEDARLTAMWLWTLRKDANGEGQAKEDGETKSIRGYILEYDAARKIAQGLGAHLENLSHLVEIKGEKATLLSAGARTQYLFGKDTANAPKGKKKKKVKQMALDFTGQLKELREESGDWSGELSGKAGNTILDQLHQSMILFAAGRGEALRRFMVEEGVGKNQLFWNLAQALSALYPPGTDEKRWVDGVLARKKGLGF